MSELLCQREMSLVLIFFMCEFLPCRMCDQVSNLLLTTFCQWVMILVSVLLGS